MQKKAIVTGCAGFIGFNLTTKLLELGWNIKGIDNFATGRKELVAKLSQYPNFQFYQKDITEDYLNVIFENVDFVFHLAALPRVSYSTDYPIESNNSNINGTLRVLEAAKVSGISRVIYSASGSMYGGDDIPFPTPEIEAHPKSNYALQKHTGSEYCRLYSSLYGLDTVSLVYFNIWGRFQYADNAYSGAIPAFFSAAVNKQKCRVDGDGETIRDWTHVSNVIQANILAATYNGTLSGERFNIGSGETYSVNQVFKEVKKLIDPDLDFYTAPARLGDPRKSHADISKAGRVLGYKPTVMFYEGMEDLAEWWKGGCKI